MLKNCDILDLPGFAAQAEDDALHAFNTQKNITDILIYLSRSNGFLQDRDIDYIRYCLPSLRPVEQENNNIEKLENLFIVATQSNAVNSGNISELKYIIDTRCKALCKVLSASESKVEVLGSLIKTLLPERTKETGYCYSEEDFCKRFFTYEKDSLRLCREFNLSFNSLIEKLPIALRKKFFAELKYLTNNSLNVVKKRVEELENAINEREKYVELLKELNDNEPTRKTEQQQKNIEMLTRIKNLSNRFTSGN